MAVLRSKVRADGAQTRCSRVCGPCARGPVHDRSPGPAIGLGFNASNRWIHIAWTFDGGAYSSPLYPPRGVLFFVPGAEVRGHRLRTSELRANRPLIRKATSAHASPSSLSHTAHRHRCASSSRLYIPHQADAYRTSRARPKNGISGCLTASFVARLSVEWIGLGLHRAWGSRPSLLRLSHT